MRLQFVVNTKGSLAQAGFVLLLLPVMSSLKGISFSQLPAYCAEGDALQFDLNIIFTPHCPGY